MFNLLDDLFHLTKLLYQPSKFTPALGFAKALSREICIFSNLLQQIFAGGEIVLTTYMLKFLDKLL